MTAPLNAWSPSVRRGGGPGVREGLGTFEMAKFGVIKLEIYGCKFWNERKWKHCLDTYMF